MATAPIDYSALADQARKTAPVDYAALAAQARQSAPSEPGMLEPHHDWTDPLRGMGAGIKQLVMHPIDTLSQMPSISATPTPTIYGAPQAQQQSVDAQNRTVADNAASIQQQIQAAKDHPAFTAGQIAGPILLTHGLSKVVPNIPEVAGKVATTVGDAAQDAGTGLLNKTAGTLKSDFKRGANPARGYLETGNGPALSMQGMADQASAAKESVGNALSQAYQQATASGKKIPVDQVATEMAKPIQKAIDLETGPGGTGNLAAIKAYVDQFAPTFDKAAANGGFTPSELFDMKRSIAQNTNWSDPAQFSLKSVRQQQTGALGGILSDVVPETSDLNQHYQDLTKFVNRVQERANTGSMPLTAHIYKAGAPLFGSLVGATEGHALAGAVAGAAMDSIPVKTTLATGLYRGGKGLSALGEKISPLVDKASDDMPSGQANDNNGNPQGKPPTLTNGSTSGPEKWASDGAEKVIQHVAKDPSSGLTKSDIASAFSTPEGKQLLIKASDLTPGSPAMRNLITQIKAKIGASE